MLIKDELELLRECMESPEHVLKRVRKLLVRIRRLPLNFSQYKCKIEDLEYYERCLLKYIAENSESELNEEKKQ